jgi:hypothetical protein
VPNQARHYCICKALAQNEYTNNGGLYIELGRKLGIAQGIFFLFIKRFHFSSPLHYFFFTLKMGCGH